MFGVYRGVLANAGLVVLGSLAGLLFKNEKVKTIGESIFKIFALFVMAMGFEGAMGVERPLLNLVSIIVGVALGELLDLDVRFTSFGNMLQQKFAKGSDSTFAKGFIEASLLFCIGSMTIMGALESGLQNEHSIYYTKGVLDMVSACTMTMGAGIGVAFSALCILIYQGILVFGAELLQNILTPETVASSVQVGSLLLIAIGFNMLKINEIKVANALPAMFIPIIWQAICLAIN